MTEQQDDPTFLQLVYTSAATVPFGDEQLETLLARARGNNTSLKVTGMLLYVDGTFFQVLEGEHKDVEALYDIIAEDDRHTNVLVLARREIAERNFGEWSMGFVHDRKTIAELPGFVDFFDAASSPRTFTDLHGDADRIRTILDGFRRGRWRREATTTTA